jgi:hypothetical protein
MPALPFESAIAFIAATFATSALDQSIGAKGMREPRRGNP